MIATALTLCAAVAAGAVWVHAVNGDRRPGSVRRHSAGRRSPRFVACRNPRREPLSTRSGVAGETAPRVLAFDASWDLTGAIRILWDDTSLHGIPGSSVDSIRCGTSGVQPPRIPLREGPTTRLYGKTVFVDVPGGRAFVVDSRSRCLATVNALLKETPA